LRDTFVGRSQKVNFEVDVIRSECGLLLLATTELTIVTFSASLEVRESRLRLLRPFIELRSRRATPSTALADLQVLLSGHADEGVRLAALERIVQRIAWHPRSPRIRRALAARASAEGKDVAAVMLQELRAAVYLVLGELGRAQVHRFGKRWLTGADGRQRPFHPERLPPKLFWTWFTDEARKTAEAAMAEGDLRRIQPISRRASLTSGPASRRQADVINDVLLALPDEDSDPLDAVLADEHRHDIDDQWQRILARATPGQRQLLQALLTLDLEGSTPSLVEAAQRLRRAPSTIRVQWKRLVERARASM
jgi:hypothetical protein